MKKDTTKPADDATEEKLFDNWFDPVETGLRAKVRGFIETMIEEELRGAVAAALRATAGADAAAPSIVGHRHGHRMRSLTGTFGPTQIAVPRARIIGEDGKTAEWKCKSLRAYQRRTRQADALIAGAYLAGTNTRRVRRALARCLPGRSARTWSAGSGGK